jgi:hypothetical protein
MSRRLDISSLLGESRRPWSPRILNEISDLPISAHRSPWDSMTSEEDVKSRTVNFDRAEDLCDFILACIEVRSICACECKIIITGNSVNIQIDDQLADTSRFINLLDGIIDESRHIR